MKKIGNSFIIAFAMYSKIPMPRTEWTKDNMKYAMCFFPVIGAVIGAVILLWNYIQGYAGFGNSFYTVVLMMIPVLITGGIHLDGLLDTSDALSSYKPMDQKLEILKDSHAGAFAIIVGICYFFYCSDVIRRQMPECFRYWQSVLCCPGHLADLRLSAFVWRRIPGWQQPSQIWL